MSGSRLFSWGTSPTRDLIALFIAWSGGKIAWEATHVLLEGTPDKVDLKTIAQTLESEQLPDLFGLLTGLPLRQVAGELVRTAGLAVERHFGGVATSDQQRVPQHQDVALGGLLFGCREDGQQCQGEHGEQFRAASRVSVPNDRHHPHRH